MQSGWQTSRGRGYIPMIFPNGLHGGGEYPVPGESEKRNAWAAIDAANYYIKKSKKERINSVLEFYYTQNTKKEKKLLKHTIRIGLTASILLTTLLSLFLVLPMLFALPTILSIPMMIFYTLLNVVFMMIVFAFGFEPYIKNKREIR